MSAQVSLTGATVLVSYYTYLADVLNNSLFAKQVDLSRPVLVGHSHGAAGATNAGRVISGFSRPKSIAYGLVAPEGAGGSNGDLHNLLVLGGTLDHDQGANPQAAFVDGGTPKTLITIPGANHFGYTDICPPDNSCGSIGLFDSNGTISRTHQQRVGAAYLAALVRYYAFGDGVGASVPEWDAGGGGLRVPSASRSRRKGFVTRPTPPVVPTTTHTPVMGPSPQPLRVRVMRVYAQVWRMWAETQPTPYAYHFLCQSRYQLFLLISPALVACSDRSVATARSVRFVAVDLDRKGSPCYA